MFKKPATLKPASPLRSSARRAFIAHLQALYPALAGASAETIAAVVPVGLKQCGATSSGGHRAVIYTDDAGKPFWFEVGHDAGAALQQSQDKKKSKGGASGSKKNQQAAQLAEVLPTIYALWILPTLLPRLPTWSQIVDPVLLSGSALMIPGLIPAPHTFPERLQRYEKHAAVIEECKENDGKVDDLPPSHGPTEASAEIALHEKPLKSGLVAITPYPSQVPLVVARLEANVEDIISKRAKGEKGKAATTLHCLGDHLWELGGKQSPPNEGDIAALNGLLAEGSASHFDALQAATTALEIDESAAMEPSEAVANGSINDEASAFTAPEIDAILHLALLQAISMLSKQSIELPLPVSALYSTHVLPNRPAYWPPRDVKGRRPARIAPGLLDGASQGEKERLISPGTVDVHHSTSKKLSRWVKNAEKADLLKTKEIKGKDTVVVSINASHPDVKGLAMFETLTQAAANGSAARQNGTDGSDAVPPNTSATASGGTKTTVVIERFWRATSSGVQLFQEMGCSTSEPLSRPVIKAYTLDFIAKKQLADTRNQSLVRLNDPLLTHALYPKAPLNEIPPALRREEIVDRILNISCQEFHRTSRLLPDNAARVLQANTKGNASTSTTTSEMPRDEPVQANGEAFEIVGKMSKGAAQSIKIEIRTRQGRKVISLITSLEVYEIDAEAFAGDLMRIAGAAASTSPLPGSTAKHPKYEVFIQGDQRKVLFELLESQHGVDRRFVQVHDMTKK